MYTGTWVPDRPSLVNALRVRGECSTTVGRGRGDRPNWFLQRRPERRTQQCRRHRLSSGDGPHAEPSMWFMAVASGRGSNKGQRKRHVVNTKANRYAGRLWPADENVLTLFVSQALHDCPGHEPSPVISHQRRPLFFLEKCFERLPNLVRHFRIRIVVGVRSVRIYTPIDFRFLNGSH